MVLSKKLARTRINGPIPFTQVRNDECFTLADFPDSPVFRRHLFMVQIFKNGTWQHDTYYEIKRATKVRIVPNPTTHY